MDQKIIYIGSIREFLNLESDKAKDPKKYKEVKVTYDMKKIRKEVFNYGR